MEKNKDTSELNKKLDLLLKNQKKILKFEEKILGEEKKLEELEEKDLEGDVKTIQTEEEALRELANLKKTLQKSKTSAIKKITIKDMVKGFIGSFIGVMSHLTFTKAASIAPTLSLTRASLIYIVSIIILIGMLYYTGFRKVEKKIVLRFVPLRVVVLFSVAILSILFVNLLFGKLHFPITFIELYKLVSANMILAVMGAATADLIGRVEE
jgi:uncharacterized membrane protein